MHLELISCALYKHTCICMFMFMFTRHSLIPMVMASQIPKKIVEQKKKKYWKNLEMNFKVRRRRDFVFLLSSLLTYTLSRLQLPFSTNPNTNFDCELITVSYDERLVTRIYECVRVFFFLHWQRKSSQIDNLIRYSRFD